MLEAYVERAGLADGQRILDLGCGWGSLSLWLARKFPRAQVVGLSNSGGQRQFGYQQPQKPRERQARREEPGQKKHKQVEGSSETKNADL